MENKKKAVCLVSGGLDSAVASSIAKDEGFDIYILFFKYGQKNLKREQKCVSKLASYLGAKEKKVIKLPWLVEIGGTALTDRKTKLTSKNATLEYVPFRNTIFLSAAVAWAEVIGADAVFIGSTGSTRVCPDNTPPYIRAMQEVARQGTKIKTDIKIRAPLLKKKKADAVKIGNKLNVPFKWTWSCHNYIDRACGVCTNCRSRLSAFKEAEMKDIIQYRAPTNSRI